MSCHRRGPNCAARLVDVRAVLDPALGAVRAKMTCFLGMPKRDANSQSRWSCAGTAMTAPVRSHQHEVRRIDRDPLAGDGMDRVEAERQSLLSIVSSSAWEVPPCAFLDEGSQRGFVMAASSASGCSAATAT